MRIGATPENANAAAKADAAINVAGKNSKTAPPREISNPGWEMFDKPKLFV